MIRRLRYHVAVSVDGFIAGPSGEYDWIVMDPSIDFAALFKEFDTAVMGRKTYEALTAQGGNGAPVAVNPRLGVADGPWEPGEKSSCTSLTAYADIGLPNPDRCSA
jgi:hypothetical protein